MKKIFLALTVLLMLFVASSCHNPEPPEEPHMHTFGEWETTSPATCTEMGKEKRSCECGESEERDIAIKDHTRVTDAPKDATCTETGLTAGEHCSACGAVFTAQTEIPMIPHTYDDSQDTSCNVCGSIRVINCDHISTEILPAKPATCTESGLTEGEKCILCGEIITAQTVTEPKGHSFGEWTVTTLATCTEMGKEKRSCECGESEERDIAIKDHTRVTDEAKDATCTETGLTAGEHCSACGTVFTAQTEIPMIPHTYDDSQDTSCNACGFIRVINCDHVSTEILPAKPATCTESGLTEGKKCILCGEIITAQTVTEPKGHSFGEWETTSPATCTEMGKEKRSCECGESEERDVAMRDHTRVTDAAKDATCTETGLTAGEHCSACGTVFTAQTEIPMIPHTYDDNFDTACNACGAIRDADCKHENKITLPAQAATCTMPGLTEGVKCGSCDEILTAQTEIPPLGHTPGAEATCKTAQTCTACGEELAPIKGHTPGAEATCKTAQTCTACGEELAPIKSHSYTSVVTPPTASEQGYTTHTCSSCGDTYVDSYVDPTSQSLKFTPSYDGNEYYVSGAGIISDTEIVIPETYKGKPVTGILDNAFEGYENLRAITIPASINFTGSNAFRGCVNLTELYITDVSAWCNAIHNSHPFFESEQGMIYLNGAPLTDLVIPNSVIHIYEYSFFGCVYISSLTLPSESCSIGSLAFYNCFSLETVENEEYVTSIDVGAFTNCPISTLDISNCVAQIGSGAFAGCVNLTSIRLPSTVEEFEDGIFIGCQSLVSVTLPSNLTIIPMQTFADCRDLATVIIPDGVSEISYQSFVGCESLNAIVIPESVTVIRCDAFAACPSLTKIFYGATPEKWDEIDIELYEDFPDSYITLTSARRYYYSEAQVSEFGKYWHFVDGVPMLWEPASSDGLKFTLNGDGESYAVTGLGDCTDKDVIIPESYNGKPVTVIATGAFKGHEDAAHITSITIPKTVIEIEESAFSHLRKLQHINVMEGNTKYVGIDDCLISLVHNPYYDTYELDTLILGSSNSVIPYGVINIGSYAFAWLEELYSISIPETVIAMGSGAFYGCKDLWSVRIESKNGIHFVNDTFNECYMLTEFLYPEECAISSAVGGDFSCTAITSFRIPWNMTEIPARMFAGCQYLSEVIMHNNVTRIGDMAFAGCNSLTSIVLPQDLTYIGEQAFEYCTKLVEIINRSSLVISCGSESHGMVALYALKIHSGESELMDLNGFIFFTSADGTHYLLGHKAPASELVLPENYNGESYEIHTGAFACCNNIESVTIPSAVTVIGAEAFILCQNLSTVIIESGVTKIGSAAFCDSPISLIVIPKTVKEICDFAFIGVWPYHVYYGGTEAEFDEITLGLENDGILYDPYYYSESAPTDDGNYWHYVDGVPTVW